MSPTSFRKTPDSIFLTSATVSPSLHVRNTVAFSLRAITNTSILPSSERLRD